MQEVADHYTSNNEQTILSLGSHGGAQYTPCNPARFLPPSPYKPRHPACMRMPPCGTVDRQQEQYTQTAPTQQQRVGDKLHEKLRPVTLRAPNARSSIRVQQQSRIQGDPTAGPRSTIRCPELCYAPRHPNARKPEINFLIIHLAVGSRGTEC